MKTKLLVVMSVIFLMSSSVLACAGFGLSKDKLNDSLMGMEELVKVDSNLNNLNILNIIWNNLKIEAGSEGDCSASKVEGDVQIVTKDVDGNYCILNGSVGLFKSEAFGNSSTISLEKDQFRCR